MTNNEIDRNHIDNNYPIVIIAGSDTGKTNLAFYFAECCSHKTKYTLGYPAKIEGYKQIWDVNDLFQLRDCLVIIDEFQKYFKRNGRHGNDALEETLDFAEHRGIKLILTSNSNQAIDRELEAKIKIWVLKKVNIHTLKQGGMCKVAMRSIKHPEITSAGISFDNSQYLWYNVYGQPAENAVYDFPNMDIGKDWANVTTNVLKKVHKLVDKNDKES